VFDSHGEVYYFIRHQLPLADSYHREWAHFDTTEPCPYHFSADEIQQHYDEVEPFNKSQEFWKELQGVLTDEGYASNESFGRASEILGDLQEAGLAGR
jgi:hypothetical protein